MDIENVSAIIIERDVEDEPIWITVGKYALFMSYGKVGIDAKSLYEHYQFTSLLQKTNSVWAADKYCRKGLDWGRDRFDKAKALLLDLDLITINQTRKEDGTFGTTYIRVHTRKVTLEPSDLNRRLPENPQADKPASGKTTTNALTNNVNALTKNRNTTKIQKITPTLEQIKAYVSQEGLVFNSEKFFDYYSKRNWIKDNNKPVLNWKNTIHTWIENKKKRNNDNKSSEMDVINNLLKGAM